LAGGGNDTLSSLLTLKFNKLECLAFGLVRLEPSRVEHLSGALLQGKVQPLPATNRFKTLTGDKRSSLFGLYAS